MNCIELIKSPGVAQTLRKYLPPSLTFDVTNGVAQTMDYFLYYYKNMNISVLISPDVQDLGQ